MKTRTGILDNALKIIIFLNVIFLGVLFGSEIHTFTAEATRTVVIIVHLNKFLERLRKVGCRNNSYPTIQTKSNIFVDT